MAFSAGLLHILSSQLSARAIDIVPLGVMLWFYHESMTPYQ